MLSLDWDHARIVRDLREDYGEARYAAFAWCDGVSYHVTFTPRGDVMRVISFRRAHKKEKKNYEKGFWLKRS